MPCLRRYRTAAEDFDREEFARSLSGAPRPPRVSRWWLLVPPVAYILRARRNHAYQEVLLHQISAKQLAEIVHYRETASGWMFVAAGGFLLAVPQTWLLNESYHWPIWSFLALLVGMLAVCITHTVARIHRRQGIMARAQQ